MYVGKQSLFACSVFFSQLCDIAVLSACLVLCFVLCDHVCFYCLNIFKADLHSELGDRGYLVFGAILFIWELLPTSLLILIFRVRQPPQEVVSILGASHRLIFLMFPSGIRSQFWQKGGFAELYSSSQQSRPAFLLLRWPSEDGRRRRCPMGLQHTPP